MKKLILFVVISLSGLVSLAEDGTRGGAFFRWHNGTGRLNDLVDPSVCEIEAGVEVRRDLEQLNTVLNKLAQVDWYLAAGLKYEIDHFTICMTRNLIRLRDSDWDSVNSYDPTPKAQGAIRILSTRDVYVDRELYNRLPEVDRPYVWIHEAMHSFIPVGAPRRISSVEGSVRAIKRAVQGGSYSFNSLRRDLGFFHVQYPIPTEKMNQSRRAIEFVLGSPEEQRFLFLQTPNIKVIVDAPLKSLADFVDSAHFAEMFVPMDTRISTLLEDSGNDLAIVAKLLTAEGAETFDPVLLALSANIMTTSATYRAYVIDRLQTDTIPKLYVKMAEGHLVVENMRVVATGSLPYLGVVRGYSQQDKIPALAIVPMNLQDWDLIRPEVRGLVQLIGFLLQDPTKGWPIVNALVVKNENFYRAFSIVPAQSELVGIEKTPIEREKAYLAQYLPQLPMGLRRVFQGKVAEFAGPEVARQLVEQIDWPRLGLVQ